MEKSCVLHEDTFYEYFMPIRHPKARHKIWGDIGLETFGRDLEIAHQCDPHHLWTVLDGEMGCQWIVPGLQYVNRVCYLTTKRIHRWIPVEFRVRSDAHSLTPLGLRRQMLKVKRLIDDQEKMAA